MANSFESNPYLARLPDSAEFMLMEVERCDGPQAYIEGLGLSYAGTTFIDYFKTLSSMVEQHDSPEGQYSQSPLSSAFMRGELLAMRAVEIDKGTLHLHLASAGSLKLRPPENNQFEDGMTTAGYMASAIMSTGEYGYSRAESFHELLDTWAPIVCPDRTLQLYLRSGFGLVLSIAEQTDKEYREKEINKHNDWDEGLAELMNEK